MIIMAESMVASRCGAGEVVERYILIHKQRGGENREGKEREEEGGKGRRERLGLAWAFHIAKVCHSLQQGHTYFTKGTPPYPSQTVPPSMTECSSF